ncbi:MAG: nicotinate-nucleotide adenylyltransferase [Actinomycetes bacterium]
MRIGIMGGTFNPIHVGHLIAASEVYRELNLDRVLFIPAGQPWQKAGVSIAPAVDRLAMVQRAIDSDARFSASDIEITHDGPTYAVETMDRLTAQLPNDEFFWIVGEDVLATLTTWHEWERFVQQVTVVVVNRQGDPDVSAPFDFIRVSMPEVRVSASQLRARYALGDDCRYLVPESVTTYVKENSLYLT